MRVEFVRVIWLRTVSAVKKLLSGRLKSSLGLVTTVAICVVVFTSMVNREGSDTSKDSDFLQRYRVIENVIIKGVVPDTEVNYTIETTSLVQFPEKGRSELFEPRVKQIDSKGVEQVLEAETGIYYEESRKVSLSGNVTISIIHPNQSNTIESTTDKLTLQLGELEN